MAIKEWEFKKFGQEISITVPDAEGRAALDKLSKKASDGFMASMLDSGKEVTIKIKQENYGTDLNGFPKTPDRFLITLPIEKARELANFLLEATEDLV